MRGCRSLRRVEAERKFPAPSLFGGSALALAAVGARLVMLAQWIWSIPADNDGPGLSLLFIAGWMLLAWAAIAAVAAVVQLFRRTHRQ